MSESLKAKQLQTSLQAEKQVLASRMQHAHAAVDVYKQRVARLEEQVCFLDFEPISMSFCFMQSMHSSGRTLS
jgi:E3 ubiquitin-protein ligase BRE1